MERNNIEVPVQFEDWQLRLRDERAELLKRTIALKKKFEDRNFKVNRVEWDALQQQFHLMRELCQVLTDRCVYYGLIEGGDLGLHYDNATRYY